MPSVFRTSLLGLNTPQLGVIEILPPPLIRGVGFFTYALVATACWGPINEISTGISDISDYVRRYGPWVTEKVGPVTYETNGYDLAQAFLEHGNDLRMLRVAGSGAEYATHAFAGSGGDVMTVRAKYKGTIGNGITVDVVNKTTTFDIRVLRGDIGKPENYKGLTEDTAESIINDNPQASIYISSITALPSTASSALAGGDNGITTVIESDYIGVPGVNKTGLELLKTLNNVSFVESALKSENIDAKLREVANNTDSIAMQSTYNKDVGVTDAILQRTDIGNHDRSIFLFNYVQYYNPYKQATVFIPPTAYVAGILARDPLRESPSQKMISVNVTDVAQQLSEAEVEQLTSAQINPVTPWMTSGIILRAGYNLSTYDATNLIARRRVTDFIGKTLYTKLQWAVSKPHTPVFRKRVQTCIKNFLDFLAFPIGDGVIEGSQVIVSENNNPQNVVEQRFCICDVRVRLWSPADFVQINLEVGETVRLSM
jgi:phage tail sheath protein FI